MNTQFPSAPGSYSPSFVNQLLTALTSYFSLAVSKDEETSRIVLRATEPGADGFYKRFDLTVDDAGVLHVTPTTKVRA